MPECSSMTASEQIPYMTPTFEAGVETGVVYAEKDGYWSQGSSAGPQLSQVALMRRPLALKMDIYYPEGDNSESRPLLLMMHGGSFLFGNREEAGQVAWCRHFASLGYVAASIDYRLGFWPSQHGLLQAERDALDDADSALACLLGRSDLRIDPTRVFAAGTSAGAILALGLAYVLYGKCPPKGFQPRLGADFRIRAVGDLWGYVRDLTVLENAHSRSRIPSSPSTMGSRCRRDWSWMPCTVPGPPANGRRRLGYAASSIPARRSVTACIWTRKAA